MAGTSSLAQRVLRIPGAVVRRIRHLLALVRARSRSLARVHQGCPHRLLVICYGNIYRSPFVAASLESRLSRGEPFEVRSAGFHQVLGRPSPPEYVELVRARHVDLASHRSRLVTRADLDWAEAVIIMDRYNWERLRPFGAEIDAKILWLGAFNHDGPIELADPYGQSLDRVQKIVDQMTVAADGLAQTLIAKS